MEVKWLLSVFVFVVFCPFPGIWSQQLFHEPPEFFFDDVGAFGNTDSISISVETVAVSVAPEAAEKHRDGLSNQQQERETVDFGEDDDDLVHEEEEEEGGHQGMKTLLEQHHSLTVGVGAPSAVKHSVGGLEGGYGHGQTTTSLHPGNIATQPSIQTSAPPLGALFKSAFEGSLSSLTELIDRGANLEERPNQLKITPLWIAAQQGHVQIVDALLKRGASTEAVSFQQLTPLYIAAQMDRLPVVEALIKAGANVDARRDTHHTALHIAAEHGHIAVMQALIKAGASVEPRTLESATPLYIAAQNGRQAAVDLLLKSGADVDVSLSFLKGDGSKHTPLHVACQNGHIQVVRMLLRNHANVHVSTEKQWTPLHMACRYSGDPEIVQALLDRGSDMEARNGGDWTPLLIAARYGHAGVVMLLLRSGADTQAKLPNGKTALQLAKESGHTTVVNVLTTFAVEDLRSQYFGRAVPSPPPPPQQQQQQQQQSGSVGGNLWETVPGGGVTSPVDFLGGQPGSGEGKGTPPPVVHSRRRGNKGRKETGPQRGDVTPLYVSAEEGHVKVVEALLRAGAATEARSTEQITPLFIAANNGHLAASRALLQAGAMVDARSASKQTPLHVAAMNGHLQIVEALLEKGANPDAKDAQRWTPLHMAAENSDDTDIVQALLDFGATVNVKDQYGWTPLGIAKYYGHMNVADVLIRGGAEFVVNERERETIAARNFVWSIFVPGLLFCVSIFLLLFNLATSSSTSSVSSRLSSAAVSSKTKAKKRTGL
uniref:Uncharacterized protein n=1 Tax=Chromera velia CCMP2878 TaxID=1169474 RepID=A0A0G4FMY1_9ALVE|mmetsp:Transcript_48542/g.95760  ORF Transcript_48542/g.95760 Transcript_48542/m.95760 type:complete len:771 (+) Transcript_48542:194-2506(+)|eukprot:Cvel_17867.t1-p1 / transcript=Cvel_17867.t1 / gene=Cvel_17867 / organism=Chromera_velia_CCMP2878 / gene_product=Ankyrin-1, putative / transcript_product=Ankyrin-1, putative / location=Cvel_scaffold1449:11452-14136(-) / protein_length=770 / sequence_SO=supercontig / SO=protein_coding / is_pseudo=false